MMIGLQGISQDAWERLFETIENSNKNVMGVSDRYVKETKRFAQKLHELLGSPNSRIGPFSIEEFEKEYTKAVYKSLEKYLRTTPEQTVKRTIIGISEYFTKANPNYHALFPIVEEPVHTRDMYDNGYYTVRLKVLLPNGHTIPLGN